MRLPKNTRMHLDKDMYFILPLCCCGIPYPSAYSETLWTSNVKQHIPQRYETCTVNAQLWWHHKCLFKCIKKFISNAFRRHTLLKLAVYCFFFYFIFFSHSENPVKHWSRLLSNRGDNPQGQVLPALNWKTFWRFSGATLIVTKYSLVTVFPIFA